MDVAAPRRDPHLRGDRAGRPAVRRALRLRRHPPHRRRAHGAGPPARCWSASWPRLGVDLSLTTNGASLRLLADDLRGRRPAAGSTSRATRCGRDRFLAITRRDALPQVLDGIDAALEPPGSRPVKVNVRAHAGRQRRRGRRLRHLRPGAGRRRALHRVHAPRRRRRLDRRPGRARRRDRRPPSTPSTRSSRSARGAASRPSATATATAGARSASSPASPSRFCGTCDRVRLTADGQFRNCLFAIAGDRPAGAAAGRRRPTTSWPRPSPPTSARKWAGHRIGQVRFVRPARSMSQIGG